MPYERVSIQMPTSQKLSLANSCHQVPTRRDHRELEKVHLSFFSVPTPEELGLGKGRKYPRIRLYYLHRHTHSLTHSLTRFMQISPSYSPGHAQLYHSLRNDLSRPQFYHPPTAPPLHSSIFTLYIRCSFLIFPQPASIINTYHTKFYPFLLLLSSIRLTF